MSEWKSLLDDAISRGDVSMEAGANIDLYLEGSNSQVGPAAILELLKSCEWQEIDDRFFKTMAFGTGGLRGRTIGKIVTQAERGVGGPLDRPEHPCVGTASMNFFNLKRAMIGLVRYVKKSFSGEGRPSLVIGHDTRHFSRDFAETCANVATDLGCDAYLFEAERATPEISFAVRYLRADSGVCLTASHNPSHDNGFKAYIDDGGQLVEPHAAGVINEVNALESENYEVLPEDERWERSSRYVFPARDSKHGKWTEWYENGQKKREQNYECGRVIGKWTSWYENGNKKSVSKYQDGGLPGMSKAIADGKFIEWYENGQKKIERCYQINRAEGKWTQWDENGQITEERYYKLGELKDWKITTIRNWINKYL